MAGVESVDVFGLPATCIGREEELATVAAFLATTALPAALVVDGEAGIGKTTIVRAALRQASELGLRVLAARPAEGERELPYAALGDLVADVARATLDILPGPQRTAIDRSLGRES